MGFFFFFFPLISKDTLKLFHSEVNVCLFHSEKKQIHGVILLRATGSPHLLHPQLKKSSLLQRLVRNLSGCPGLRRVTQPAAARQRNFAHPWITAEITGEFITQGEIRGNVGECAADNILSCVSTAQPFKGTPCANVAFRRPPWGRSGPSLLAGFGGTIAHDSRPEARTPSRAVSLPGPRQSPRMETCKQKAIFHVGGGS